MSGQIIRNTIIEPQAYTVATVPTAADHPAGSLIYVSDGAAGSPTWALAVGANWVRLDDASTNIAIA